MLLSQKMEKFTNLAEKIFIVVSLFLATPALVPVLVNTEDASGTAPDPYTPILFMLIYGVTGVLVILRWKSFLHIATKDIFIWLLVAIALLSMLWTVMPDITQRRSILLLGTTVFGIYIATRFDFREQLELYAWALGLVIILSFVFAIALPYYGIMSVQENGAHAGAWRGVMTHKNILGRLMALTNMLFLLMVISHPIRRGIYRWLTWICYVLSIALVVLSTSKTSLVATITLTIILPLYRSLRQKYTVLIPSLIVFILVVGSVGTIVIENLETIAGTFGRDLTLTGRTDIWIAMWDLIAERPLTGYGFNAFWQGWDSVASARMWRILGWECPYGHNGFIDLMAELGAPCLILFILSFVTTYIKGISWLRLVPTAEGLWPLMYLTFMLIYNMTESTIMATNSIFWIIYVSTIFSMAVEYEQAKIFNYEYKESSEELLA